MNPILELAHITRQRKYKTKGAFGKPKNFQGNENLKSGPKSKRGKNES